MATPDVELPDPTALFLAEIRRDMLRAVSDLIAAAGLRSGQLLVVGCSTSEVAGSTIGSGGSLQVADTLLEAVSELTQQQGIYLACQCCEHLNRALVVSGECRDRYGLEEVSVVPVPKAGGAFAASAMGRLPQAAVVEDLRNQAHAGLDIGQTLIGMHLRRVAVPIRLGLKNIGQAVLTAARTRPRLIGGERAIYRL